MFSIIKLHATVILRYILFDAVCEKRAQLAGTTVDRKKANGNVLQVDSTTLHSKDPRELQSRQATISENINDKSSNLHGESMLDSNGPRLIEGVRKLLFFYQFVGVINWKDRPLYLSILFHVTVLTLVLSKLFANMNNYTNMKLYNSSYTNPILLLIGCLCIMALVVQYFVNVYTSLFKLCPLFRVLNTPRLCFVKEEVLNILGSGSLVFILIAHVYSGVLFSMCTAQNLEDFVRNFSILSFLADLYVNTVCIYYFAGPSFLDLYIRSAFGHWLLALKSHLEQRFTYLHKSERLEKERDMEHQAGYCSFGLRGLTKELLDSEESRRRDSTLRLVSFDEIQKNLNNMDDHLEVLRSTQVKLLVLMSLNTFLANGSLFLISYHLIADQSNFYHGVLLLLIAINILILTFLVHFGDWWLSYALNSFVQSVEDEYFLQNDLDATTPQSQSPTRDVTSFKEKQSTKAPVSTCGKAPSIQRAKESAEMFNNHQMLIIKKKDVLFCREFSHQFENHLATPWTKLEFITFLHMARAFVTLIAAQIVFDHEH